MACVNCKDSILSQTPSLIANTKCPNPCPEETTCSDGVFASACVYYSGANLGCAGVNYGDTLSVVIQKMDAKYGVRVTETDNCCGFLADKLISSDDSVSISQTVVGNCQKLDITVASAICEVLEWLPLDIESPFTTPTGIVYVSGDYSFDMGEPQAPEYAIEYCNGNVKKVWLRGIIEIPQGSVRGDFNEFFTLLSTTLTTATTSSGGSIIPAKTRMIPIGMPIVANTATWWFTVLIDQGGNMHLSTSYIYNILDAPGEVTPAAQWISLDGFSYEVI